MNRSYLVFHGQGIPGQVNLFDGSKGDKGLSNVFFTQFKINTANIYSADATNLDEYQWQMSMNISDKCLIFFLNKINKQMCVFSQSVPSSSHPVCLASGWQHGRHWENRILNLLIGSAILFE